MSSREIINSILEDIYDSILLVERRFTGIYSVADFGNSTSGVDTLDAICMRLQVIGESVKSIDKIDKSFLESYPEIDWSKIKALRDIISHQYAHINVEIIFDVCKNKLPELKAAVSRIKK